MLPRRNFDYMARNMSHFFEWMSDEMDKVLPQYVLSYTPQIVYNNKGVPQSRGTAVLLQIDECYFIVTAAHVLEAKLFYSLRLDQYMLPLKRQSFMTVPMNAAFPEREYDIAFSQLDTETVQEIKSHGFDFITHNQIDWNYEPHGMASFYVLGFPDSKWKVRHKEVTYMPFLFKSQYNYQFDFKRFKRDRNLHLPVACTDTAIQILYAGKKVENQSESTLPKLTGISGGGVWSTFNGAERMNPIHMQDLTQNIKLAGIVIERVRQEMPQQAIIATRIDQVVYGLHVNLGIGSATWFK